MTDDNRVGPWDLSRLTQRQKEITYHAIVSADFDWNLLVPGLMAQKRRDYIPVEWVDLSRYQQDAQAMQDDQAHDHRGNAGHEHEHGDDHGESTVHWHVEEEGDEAHVLAIAQDARAQALGLAWYSGKISIDSSLENEPELAVEVFLAEGAHMVDFFYMTDVQRRAIFDAYHPGMTQEQLNAHYGSDPDDDGWFEEHGDNDYWSWVGESFMSGFIKAYAPQVPTPLEPHQPWVHKTTITIGHKIREILTPAPIPEPDPEPQGDPNPPTEPSEPDPKPVGRYFADSNGDVYHDSHNHPNISIDRYFETTEEAEAAGLRPCEVCKPKDNTDA